jgi:hypothetical protein
MHCNLAQQAKAKPLAAMAAVSLVYKSTPYHAIERRRHAWTSAAWGPEALISGHVRTTYGVSPLEQLHRRNPDGSTRFVIARPTHQPAQLLAFAYYSGHSSIVLAAYQNEPP